MKNLAFPFHFDNCGRTAMVSYDDHIRGLIEQILFTHPGERVNRPEFGSGLLQMVFAPNSSQSEAAWQFTTQAALQHWMGDLIELQDVQVVAEDDALRVQVQYVIRRTRQQQVARFTKGGPGR